MYMPIRGEGAQGCAPAATHSGTGSSPMNRHEAVAPELGEKIC
nr:MAG TPA: hypothetical protein [Caudoviricetes sp.]